MPWIVPRATARLTSRLAWTAPKRLPMWRSSIAEEFNARPSHRALPVRHVVVHLDLAVLDVGGRGLDRAAHLGRDERLVVVVVGPGDAVLFQTEDAVAAPVLVARLREGGMGRDVDALHHRGQHLPRVEHVLIRIDPDAELAGVSDRAQHADA